MAKRAPDVEPEVVSAATVHSRTRKNGLAWEVSFRHRGKQMSRTFTDPTIAQNWCDVVRFAIADRPCIPRGSLMVLNPQIRCHGRPIQPGDVLRVDPAGETGPECHYDDE